MFSMDTETGFQDVVVINASYGLGENIVQGSVNPDEFYVFKPTLMKGFRPILQEDLGSKEFKLVYDIGGSKMVKNIPVSEEDRKRFRISRRRILALAKWACQIENHYTEEARALLLRWIWNGPRTESPASSSSSRPVRKRFSPTKSRGDSRESSRVTDLKPAAAVLLEGRSVGEKIAPGPVRVIKSVQDLGSLQKGRDSRHGQDRSGLGARHEKGRGDHHQSRRPHLPCRDREPGARPSRRRRNANRHREAARRADRSP